MNKTPVVKTQETMTDFGELGRYAAGVAISLVRIQQSRQSSKDIDKLLALAKGIRRVFEEGKLKDTGIPFLDSIEGLYVLIKAANAWHDEGTARHKLLAIADDLVYVASESDLDVTEKIRNFFREVHDVAMEIVTLGLRENPVFIVFAELPRSWDKGSE